MIQACIPANGLFFLLPGLMMGVLLTVVIVLRHLYLDARDDIQALANLLDDQLAFMSERGIHWGWWDNVQPWHPASNVADSPDSRYAESETVPQKEAS